MEIHRPLPPDVQSARITELWCWTVIDPLTDVEGIIAVTLAGKSVPMVGATRELVERYEPFARRMGHEIEAPVALRRFVAAPPG